MTSRLHSILRLLVTALAVSTAPAPAQSADLVVVVGAPGTDEFAPPLAQAAEAWEKVGQQGEARIHVIGRDATGKDGDLRALAELIPTLAGEKAAPLWIVLLGHGTFDGRVAKFNLRDRDLEAPDLAAWLEDAQRPIAVINCSSASAPFLKALSAPGRVIITATKSGFEESYSRFGTYLATHIDSPEADRDQDGTTSLLEAFLAASTSVNEFYDQQGRIVTEEALIDDNGDGAGTPADWFRGVRAVRTAKEGATPDGQRAHQLTLVPGEEERTLTPEQRTLRNRLENELFALRQKKGSMPEEAYFRELERIVRALAEIYAPQETPGDKDS